MSVATTPARFDLGVGKLPRCLSDSKISESTGESGGAKSAGIARWSLWLPLREGFLLSLIQLIVDDLRCLQRAELSLDPRRNLIWGSNGSGKTSLLESIFQLDIGR